MRRRGFLATAGTGLVTLAGCNEETGPSERSIPATDSTVLVVTNWNGNVLVRGEERPDITVTARSADGGDATVTVERTDDIVDVRTRSEDNDGPVDLQVSTPRTVALERADSGGGDVVVRGAGGDPGTATNSGDIELTDCRGVVGGATNDGSVTVRRCGSISNVRAQNGTADIELTELLRSAPVRTLNGDAVLRLFEGIQADVNAEAVDGEISVTGLDVDAEERTDRRLVGRLGEGGYTLTIRARNGDIELRTQAGDY